MSCRPTHYADEPEPIKREEPVPVGPPPVRREEPAEVGIVGVNVTTGEVTEGTVRPVSVEEYLGQWRGPGVVSAHLHAFEDGVCPVGGALLDCPRTGARA